MDSRFCGNDRVKRDCSATKIGGQARPARGGQAHKTLLAMTGQRLRLPRRYRSSQ